MSTHEKQSVASIIVTDEMRHAYRAVARRFERKLFLHRGRQMLSDNSLPSALSGLGHNVKCDECGLPLPESGYCWQCGRTYWRNEDRDIPTLVVNIAGMRS